jgi:hypothetical protein
MRPKGKENRIYQSISSALNSAGYPPQLLFGPWNNIRDIGCPPRRICLKSIIRVILIDCIPTST